jgi:hypothetical protein
LNFQRPQVLMRDGRPAYLFAPSGSNIYSEDGSGSVCYVLKCNWDKVKQSEPPEQEPKPRALRNQHHRERREPVLRHAGEAQEGSQQLRFFNGFMQWQSDDYPYGLKQSPWRGSKGDVVGDFVKYCRKADVLPGVFFSTHRNVCQEVWGHYVKWGKGLPSALEHHQVARPADDPLLRVFPNRPVIPLADSNSPSK